MPGVAILIILVLLILAALLAIGASSTQGAAPLEQENFETDDAPSLDA